MDTWRPLLRIDSFTSISLISNLVAISSALGGRSCACSNEA